MISISNSLKSFYLLALVILGVTLYALFVQKDEVENSQLNNSTIKSSPTSLEMYKLLETYADKYEVPRYIAYNIAYLETRYKGPFDWSYRPELESNMGAVGPMQVMVSTAKLINKKYISKQELKNSLEVNIETSMKLLRHLYNTYKDWGIVCGAYNTGQPIINDYARYCITHKDYQSKWIFYQK